MANRRVTVELQAKTAGYVTEIRRSEAATSELNATVDELGKHDKEFDDLAAAAVGLAGAAKGAEHEVDGLKRQTDETGTQLKETAVDAKFLTTELAKTKREALELAAAFAATGDKTKLADLKQKNTYLNSLQRVFKQVTDGNAPVVDEAKQAGTYLGKTFTDSMSKSAEADVGALQGIGGTALMFAPVLLPIVLAAGAMLGGAMGGAIVSGLAVAGIGAGVLAATREPAVQEAIAGLGKEFSGMAGDVAAEFKGPVVESVHAVQTEVTRLRPEFAAISAELAPMTTQLTGGLVSGIDRFASHLTGAFGNIQPIIDELSRSLPNVLDAVGGLLENLSEHSSEEAFALRWLFGVIIEGIKVLEGFADAGSHVIDVIQGTADLLSHIPGLGKLAADSPKEATATWHTFDDTVKGTTVDLGALESQLKQTTVTTNTLAGAMADKLFKSQMSADEATLHLAESQTALTSALKQNKHTLDIHTAAGQANREAVLAVVAANIKQYDTMIAAGASAKDAAAAYDINSAALRKQLHDAHYTDAQINALIGTYSKVPDSVNTDIAMNGLTDAINGLDDLLRKLNGLPPRVTTTIETIHITRNSPTPYARGGYWDHRASDGFFIAPSNPGTVLTAEPETGGEWLIPSRGISASRAAMLLNGAASSYGLAVSRPANWRGGGSGSMAMAGANNSVNLTVHSPRAQMTASELATWQRYAEVHQRVGRPH